MENQEQKDLQSTGGRVRRACQNWQVLEDECFAYRLQDEEISGHYDRNRQNSRLLRDDFHTALREQSTEQEVVELTRRQEEAEAEELAAQLSRLLDEERLEEDTLLLDEQLARKLAQEDHDEVIAREQQDRELARMLQAKERLKAKRIREARRRREEAVASATSSTAAEGTNESEMRPHETSGESIYANIGPPLREAANLAGNRAMLPHSDYAVLAVRQGNVRPAASRRLSAAEAQAVPLSSDRHANSIELLKDFTPVDVPRPDAATATTTYSPPCASRLPGAAGGRERPASAVLAVEDQRRYSRHSSAAATAAAGPMAAGGPSIASRSAMSRTAQVAHLEDDCAIPPYMPMQGIPQRRLASPVGVTASPSSSIAGHYESTSKKSSSCKAQ